MKNKFNFNLLKYSAGVLLDYIDSISSINTIYSGVPLLYNNNKRKKKKNNNNNNVILKFHWRKSLNYTLRSRNANNCLAIFFLNVQWSKNSLFSSLNNIYAGMSYSQSYFFLILSFQFSINRVILTHTFLWLFYLK